MSKDSIPPVQVKDEEKVEKPNRTLEDVLESAGGLGRFQIFALVYILFFEIPGGMVSFMPVFTGMTPKTWQCISDNGTSTEMNSVDICSCKGTRYSPVETIVTEWDMTCEYAWVADTIASIQMGVMFIGNIVPAQLSDWYGRKPAVIGVILTMLFGNIGSALSTDPYTYTFFRCIVGVGVSGFMTIDQLYAMEFLTTKWRQLSSCLSTLGEGVLFLGILGYFVQPWRSLTWAITIPCLLVVFMPLVPESPRWLLRQGKVEEAEKVFRYIAKVNGKKIQNLDILQEIASQEQTASSSTVHFTYLDLFRKKEYRRKTIIFMCIWFCWTIQYFGSIFNVANFGIVDAYLMLTLLGLVDCVGFRVALLVNNKLGRRGALLLFESFAAVFFFIVAMLELFVGLNNLQIVALVLTLIGKLGVSMARTSISILTTESYPVSIRAMGTGVAKVALVVASIFAPQLGYVGRMWPSVPLFAFAVLGLVGASMSLLLPETGGKPLQDSMNDPGSPVLTEKPTHVYSEKKEKPTGKFKDNDNEIKSYKEPITLIRTKSILDETL